MFIGKQIMVQIMETIICFGQGNLSVLNETELLNYIFVVF